MEPGHIPRVLSSTSSHSGQLVATPSGAEPFVSTNDNDGSGSLPPASGPSRSARSASRPVHGSAGKQPPSCDACRTRKLKCSGRPEVIELDQGIAKIPCEVSMSRRWTAAILGAIRAPEELQLEYIVHGATIADRRCSTAGNGVSSAPTSTSESGEVGRTASSSAWSRSRKRGDDPPRMT